MKIHHLKLTNFRCFAQYEVAFNQQYVVLQGPNGSGKSSLLEALHYGCYLRSFRTHNQKELVALGKDFFSVSIGLTQNHAGLEERDDVHIGFSNKEGKLVRLNQKTITNYRDLVAHIRVVSLADHDLQLIAGSPEVRREFLTYALMLDQPDLVASLKKYRQTLEQRNKLLSYGAGGAKKLDELATWTSLLWQESQNVRSWRTAYLNKLGVWVNRLLEVYEPLLGKALQLECDYTYKGGQQLSFQDFWRDYYPARVDQEFLYKRSLFGAHLDDFALVFNHKHARYFASRGQQKLLVFLIKVAQLQLLQEQGFSGVLLLDDFLTDFDHAHVQGCAQVLQTLPYQVFFTVPVVHSALERVLAGGSAQIISVSH